MSNNGHGWKPRKVHTFTCADGSTVLVQRPGPELALRVQRIPRTFTKSLVEKPSEGNEQDDSPEARLAQMSDEEQNAVVALARELIVAMVVSPKLKLNPKEGELGPDDTGADFWPLFTFAMTNFYDIKVPVAEGEVEVPDLETFRNDSGLSGDSVDGAHIPIGATEPDHGNQGLVDSAGA